MSPTRSYAKRRADHYLPKAYLSCFIDPARRSESLPLSVWRPDTGKWRNRSPSQLGWETGFYDYAGVQGERVHPDVEFAFLESEYPKLIARLRAINFADWRGSMEFLMRYIQMIRCRSPLFREQFLREWNQKTGARVVAVNAAKNEVTVDSLKLRHFSPGALKDGAILRMMEEMKKKGQLCWRDFPGS